jgi:hypothetical protein
MASYNAVHVCASSDWETVLRWMDKEESLVSAEEVLEAYELECLSKEPYVEDAHINEARFDELMKKVPRLPVDLDDMYNIVSSEVPREDLIYIIRCLIEEVNIRVFHMRR